MNIKQYARWLVIGGACLAFIGFFLPGISISTSMDTALDLGFSVDETYAFADMASDNGSIFIIPICFAVTIVLNFVFHSSNQKSEQRKLIYILEWITSVFGVLLSFYWFFRVNSMLSEFSSAYNESIIGLVATTDIKVIPGFGFYLILAGFGMLVYGLQADGITEVIPSFSPSSSQNNIFSQQNNSSMQRDREEQFDDIDSWNADAQNFTGVQSSINSGPPIAVPVPVSVREGKKKKISAWLVSREGRNYQLRSGETTIGRSSDNDIQLSNPKISKHHAKIIEVNNHFKLMDLGSTNGTWLNGKLVRQPVALQSEDEIRFGDSFKVQFVAISK